MAETAETAGYAPATGVVGIIEKCRQRTLDGPIDSALLKRIGVPDSLIKRTLNSLRFLDLVEPSGATTPTFDALVAAHPDDYQGQFAEVVKKAYSKVFAIVDPAIASPDELRNAFWGFEPRGQTDNMIRLFLALCQEAGIIEGRPKSEPSAKRKRTTPSRRSPNGQEQLPRAELPDPGPPLRGERVIGEFLPHKGEHIIVNVGAGTVTLIVDVRWLDLDDQTFMDLRKLTADLRKLAVGEPEDEP
jgi:hypothetical protein